MAARFPMAVVVTGSPLTVTIEGASAVVAAEDFVGGLTTGDRVQAAFLGDRLTVLARAGGAGDAAATANTLALRDANARIKAADGVAADDVVTVGQLPAVPYAEQVGTVAITGDGTIQKTATITFQASLFSQAPAVFIQSAVTTSGAALVASPESVTTSGATIRLARADGGVFSSGYTLYWRAEQIASGASTGYIGG